MGMMSFDSVLNNADKGVGIKNLKVNLAIRLSMTYKVTLLKTVIQ